jgi:hypothetical protein
MPSSTENTQAQLPTAVMGCPSKLLTDVAKGTMAFQLEKPPKFAFRVGQSIDLSLVGPAQDSPHKLTQLSQWNFRAEPEALTFRIIL